MEQQPVSWEVVVSGLVQGVYFRAFTKRAADELGVRGWVANAADGSVEALLQHEEEALLALLVARLRQGPPASRVTEVSVRVVETAERLSGFAIVRR